MSFSESEYGSEISDQDAVNMANLASNVKSTTQAQDNYICGYLYKKTKDKRWQRRWFETNGIYLTYYKSRKVEKLLAALSLPQVGEIKPIKEDGEVGLFSIELNTRIYVLRAKSDEEALVWVETLTRLRNGEAAPNSSKETTTSDKAALKQAAEASFYAEVPIEPKNDWNKQGRWFCRCC
jgi:hypothetical protein